MFNILYNHYILCDDKNVYINDRKNFRHFRHFWQNPAYNQGFSVSKIKKILDRFLQILDKCSEPRL